MMTQEKPRYLIVGLGLTGWSCIRCLHQEGYRLEVADTRLNPPFLESLQREYPEIPCHLDRLPIEGLATIDAIVISPGLDIEHPFFKEAKTLGVEIMGDIDLFRARVTAPIIGITGTNAKSTVTTLVGAFLNEGGIPALLGGNLGTPALDLLSEPTPAVYVLELSSYQLDLTHFLPLVSATILNIAPDHLDRYGTMEKYQQSKLRIYDQASLIVANRADEKTKPVAGFAGCTFGLSEPTTPGAFGIQVVDGKRWFAEGQRLLCPVAASQLVGRHNEQNVLAAMALVSPFHLPPDVFARTLKTFYGLPHRCQVILQKNEVCWINDSKGTNVAASLTAIEALKSSEGRLVLILGGQLKKEDYAPLVPIALKAARAVIVMGEAAPLFYDLFKAHQQTLTLQVAESMLEAVKMAFSCAEAGDTVLFSPACPSWDRYNNYAERGQDFIHQVQACMKEGLK